MKLALALMLSFAALTARAQSACLANASNADLMDELSNRLGQNGGGGGSDLTMAFFCNGKYLHLKITDLQTGIPAEYSYDAATESNCSQTALVVQAKTRRLVHGGQFAFCNGRYLHTVTVTRDAKVVDSSNDVGTNASCDASADQINKN